MAIFVPVVGTRLEFSSLDEHGHNWISLWRPGRDTVKTKESNAETLHVMKL